MKIKCPNCKKVIEWNESEYRPFCSGRCKMVDFGAWISEDYKVVDESDEDVVDLEQVFKDDEYIN